ncbi:hypothetical protein CRV11_00205 [Candidatus Pantoea edessiphila]|uniref:Uncharacterized protein n=1 Tax=Candidatus Pantoea edessiphila TaxID=2044610 RepID=A0A2P5SYH1_9GAMM|nr:YrzE family protein [Candidatus Pantoea edessiphila]MBK4775521.1 hypothetical protein [Pantoea sp. Edef]PPI87352.1 hypothetical protein CRV11_00205 [Candidatus Pantoea edessiphila]
MFDTKINDNMEKNSLNQRTSDVLHGSSICWSSIFVGVIFTFIIHIFFTLLGTVITKTVIDQNGLYKIGNNVLIWTGVTLILSISVGSFIAGRLARCAGALHGLLVFCLNTLITVWLAFLLSTNILGDIMNIAYSNLKNIEDNINGKSISATKWHNNKKNVVDRNTNKLKGEVDIGFSNNFDKYQSNLDQMVYKLARTVYNDNMFYITNDLNISHIDLVGFFQKTQNYDNNILSVNDTKISNKKAIISNIKKPDREIDKAIKEKETDKKLESDINKQETTSNKDILPSNNAAFSKIVKKSITKHTWFTLGVMISEACLSIIMGIIGYRSKFN